MARRWRAALRLWAALLAAAAPAPAAALPVRPLWGSLRTAVASAEPVSTAARAASVFTSALRRSGTEAGWLTFLHDGSGVREARQGPQQALNVSCNARLSLRPKDVSCPGTCPYLRVEPDGICDFRCVKAERCAKENPLQSFPDPHTMHCSACKVPACAACGGSSRNCVVCHEGYVLIDGQCYDRNRWWWRVCYVLLAATAGLLVTYLATLAVRPTVNSFVCNHALNFRAGSQLHDGATGKTHSLWSTSVQRDYIAGVGVMLHFTWQFWVTAWALCVGIVMYLLAWKFNKRPNIAKMEPQFEDYYQACNEKVEEQLTKIAYMEVVYFWATFGIYVTTTVASLAFAVRQRRFAERVSQQLTTMQDFVLFVHGLPKLPGTQKVEVLLKEAFQQRLASVGVEVVGVSPCWDFRTCTAAVQKQVSWEVEQQDLEHEQTANLDGPRSAMKDTLSTVRRREGRWSLELRRLDAVFNIGHEADEDEVLPEDKQPNEVRAMLESLYTSGEAYLVLRTEAQRNKALRQLQERPFSLHGKTATASRVDTEPETVLWENFGTRQAAVVMNIVLGVVAMAVAVALLDVIFYFPSVAYLISVSGVAGMSEGGFEGMLLGLLVCICNQIIYLIIGRIADKCGFKSKDEHQVFYVVGYTWAVFFNTILDLFTVLLMAEGFTMEQAIHLQTDNRSTMSTKAIAENPSIQMAVYTKYAEYLFPSCLMVPFLLEPVIVFGLFNIKKWIVRSRTDVSLQEAEKELQCDPFDLSRYGDSLINVMLCCGIMAFTYRDLYFLWFCLVLSQTFVFFWDKYRLLRVSIRSFFVSSVLEETAQYLMAGPCAILAGCLVFRLYGQKSGEVQGNLEPWFKSASQKYSFVASLINRDTIVVVMAICAGLHIILHCYALNQIIPRWCELNQEHDENVEYATKGKEIPCNWFNANPVYCLRSKYVYKYEVPCLNFCAGKEYLLRANPEIGCDYENQDFKQLPEESLLGLVSGAATELLEEASKGLALLSPQASPLAAAPKSCLKGTSLGSIFSPTSGKGKPADET